jgi:hypothetical protein
LTVRRWRQDATELERVAEDGRGNRAGAQDLRTRRAACLHRPDHIPGLLRSPFHKPGQRRTQKVWCGGDHREIWLTGLTGIVLAGRRAIAGPPSNITFGRAWPYAAHRANGRKMRPLGDDKQYPNLQPNNIISTTWRSTAGLVCPVFESVIAAKYKRSLTSQYARAKRWIKPGLP